MQKYFQNHMLTNMKQRCMPVRDVFYEKCFPFETFELFIQEIEIVESAGACLCHIPFSTRWSNSQTAKHFVPLIHWLTSVCGAIMNQNLRCIAKSFPTVFVVAQKLKIRRVTACMNTESSFGCSLKRALSLCGNLREGV